MSRQIIVAFITTVLMDAVLVIIGSGVLLIGLLFLGNTSFDQKLLGTIVKVTALGLFPSLVLAINYLIVRSSITKISRKKQILLVLVNTLPLLLFYGLNLLNHN